MVQMHVKSVEIKDQKAETTNLSVPCTVYRHPKTVYFKRWQMTGYSGYPKYQSIAIKVLISLILYEGRTKSYRD